MKTTFTHMLAVNAPPAEQIRYPVLASPKLDGVRGSGIGGQALSRKLLPFKNTALQEFFATNKLENLDGEFIQGSPTQQNVFGKTQSVTSSYDSPIKDLTFWVFDDFTNPMVSFHERLVRAHTRIKGLHGVRAVEHHLVSNPQELDEYEEWALSEGYEGVMLRSLDGIYKFGRSTVREGWLMKVKRFEDSECVIDDAEELMHNQNEKTLVANGKAKRNHKKEGLVPGGVMGKLCVRDIHTGVAFKIGTGFSARQRQDLWAMHQRGELVGKVGTYKWLPAGTKDKPRSGVWKDFRDDV